MKRFLARCTILSLSCVSFLAAGTPAALALADLRPEQVHVADAKKTKRYIREGLVTGGDKSVNEVVIKDIRRSKNAGYERIVIDLEGNLNGEAMAIPRPPYYQVAVSPDEKRLTFTVFGKPRLALDSKRVTRAFAKSAVVRGIELFPAMESDNWTFALNLKGKRAVEVFELGEPARVILDIRTE